MSDRFDNSADVDLNDVILSERKRWTFFGLPFTFTKYSITHKKIIIQSGLLTSLENEILLYRVMDLSLRRTLFQKMFGLGTVIISSRDKTSPELEVTNIKNSKLFMDTVSELVEEDKLRRNVRHGEVMENNGVDDDYDDGFYNFG